MKKILVIITVLVALNINAQQDPQYTQYMYNMSTINPAYAGSVGGISMGLLYRAQWQGLDGAPRTGTFFGHAPVSEKIGVGLSIVSDKTGPYNETNLTADFSYTIKFPKKRKLSFGLKSGASFYDIGLIDVITSDPNDPLYGNNINSINPIIGVGLLYHTDKYYISASIPNVLESLHMDYNGHEIGSEYRHYYLTAGYLFKLSENASFKPSFLVKSAFEAPASFDLNANFKFYDKVEIGASYRVDDSLSGLINFDVTPNITIGYAYDRVTSSIQYFASASHEFLLLIDLKSSKDNGPAKFF